jgi:5-methylthioadenosine/S-adenosylhomocysteine deaminase
MSTLYCARWVLPVSSPPIADGAIAVTDDRIVAVGDRGSLQGSMPEAFIQDFGDAAIIPGLINAHTHLELTAMRGFLEDEETDFFWWLKKLTLARLEKLTKDDLYISAAWGAVEAVRAGVTCVADASDSALESMRALHEVGIRGIVFQESFGPDPRLVKENFENLKAKIVRLREHETARVKCGVSPHAPYTVCAPQLELISEFVLDAGLPLMMHAAETSMEVSLLREGCGPFAEGLRSRGIEWQAPEASTVQYLHNHGILETRPLLAHCIHVDNDDIETIKQSGTCIAHCPKSNAKLRHGRAPFAKFLDAEIPMGFGSDSVASNNTCDILEEARFALLIARTQTKPGENKLSADEALRVATHGGASALGLQGRVGELREGLEADFVVVSLEGSHQIPAYDPVTSLIFSSSGRDVVLTVIAGREVYRDGRVAGVDEEQLRARMNEIAVKLSS